ncbi:MAG TPA: recombination-associated protein RdgC [Nevskiaceae bacterium]|nr:recombination-associated protein RdgC [Nevskiaceae bacterium]
MSAFRNVTFFRMPKEFADELSASELEARLAEHPLRHCGLSEMKSSGFVAPNPQSVALAIAEGPVIAVALGIEERIVPGATLQALVQDKIAAYTAEKGKPPGGKTRRAIKESALAELLPLTLVKPSTIRALLNPAGGWVALDTTSAPKADLLGASLRTALGTYPVIPVCKGEWAPRLSMTRWLADDAWPAGLAPGNTCSMKDPATGATARVGHQELDADEVKRHLKAGKQCQSLELTYFNRTSFVLHDKLTLSGFRLVGDAMDELKESDHESADAEYHATLALLAGELGDILKAMDTWFALPG